LRLHPGLCLRPSICEGLCQPLLVLLGPCVRFRFRPGLRRCRRLCCSLRLLCLRHGQGLRQRIGLRCLAGLSPCLSLHRDCFCLRLQRVRYLRQLQAKLFFLGVHFRQRLGLRFLLGLRCSLRRHLGLLLRHGLGFRLLPGLGFLRGICKCLLQLPLVLLLLGISFRLSLGLRFLLGLRCSLRFRLGLLLRQGLGLRLHPGLCLRPSICQLLR